MENNKFVQIAEMDINRFYVQYAGTMGYVFDYKMIVQVAELLKNEKDIIFQMIGEGSQKQDFENLVRKENLII